MTDFSPLDSALYESTPEKIAASLRYLRKTDAVMAALMPMSVAPQAPPAAAATQECGGQDANPATLITPHSSHGMGTQPVVVPFAPRNGAPKTTPPPEPAEQLAWIEWRTGRDEGWTTEDAFNFRYAFIDGYRAKQSPPAAVALPDGMVMVQRADLAALEATDFGRCGWSVRADLAARRLRDGLLAAAAARKGVES